MSTRYHAVSSRSGDEASFWKYDKSQLMPVSNHCSLKYSCLFIHTTMNVIKEACIVTAGMFRPSVYYYQRHRCCLFCL